MQYTLDSIVQVQQALKEGESGFDYTPIPILYTKLSQILELTQSSPNNIYFGILTVGIGNSCTIYSSENDSLINVDENSQIVELFDHLVFLDNQGQLIDNNNIKAQFRGFVITAST